MGVQVGRGLGALIKSDNAPTQSAPQDSGRKERLRALEDELLDIKVRITARRKELESLRKDLTIKLMLNGKVDKTSLLEAEDELSKLVERRDQLVKELETLRTDGQNAPEDTSRYRTGQAPRGPSLSTDLDMRMVRELLSDQGPSAGQASDDRPPGDRSYVEKLKDELSPKKEAMKLRAEAGRTQGPAAPPSPVRPAVQVSAHVAPPEQSPGRPVLEPPRPAGPQSPQRQASVAPRKVRVKLGTVKPANQPKDKNMYDIIDRAIALMETGDPGSSKEVLLKALNEYPMDDELLYHLGNAFFMLGDLDNAEVRFRKAVERNPISYRALNNLGIVLRKKGKREQAIRALNQSLEVNNRYERAWFNLGTIFMEIEPPLLKEAQIFLKRALECDPNYLRAREKLSEVELMLQKAA